MSFEEKQTWASALIGIAIYGIYLAVIFQRAGDAPLHTVSYAYPMLIAIGCMIVAMIVFTVMDHVMGHVMGHVMEHVVSHQGDAQSNVSHRENSHPNISRREIGQKDERDLQIYRYGQTIGYGVQSFAFLTVLGLVLLELPHFWIGQALFFSCFLELSIKSAAKICAYRRGFQQW